MKGYFLTNSIIKQFRNRLVLEEKSSATIEKYCRDVERFRLFVGNNEITKELVLAYKSELKCAGYAIRSINSMLTSINIIFNHLGWNDLKVKTIKVQNQIYCPEEKELTKSEYERLVKNRRPKRIIVSV